MVVDKDSVVVYKQIEKFPKEGDLRYHVINVDKRKSSWGFKTIKQERILQRYDGHTWKELPEFWSSITV